jgi:peroxiredoxin
MKLIYISVATGMALASAGALLYYVASRPPVQAPVAIDPSVPRHPVTQSMIQETGTLARKVAPAFTARDVEGKSVRLSGDQSSPQLVLFIKADCPCSVDAQPIFNSLSKHFTGKVNFVGVIDADSKEAAKWVAANRPVFPVLPDPKLEIIHAYQAKHSVYSALVTKDGHIQTMWPGYSIGMLKEINAALAASVGEKLRPFDTAYAPAQKTSGCAFGQPGGA